ncbi:mitochondrial 54S ribosomal protein mL40 [Kwoniella pini CBS 10737]|uniref:Uncharacterized protein n=1 Tax=Kwoniella pini CBS 10737 TaxID=1296096 RepID=A0A1B9I3E7_9TREE|nr:uncharacterized protein I206_04529 [Kwoniella pini CBS 10737]OCF49998.1 hypothetical protein I206_04529 [Kwoniella pini CBS 10737]
MSRPILSRVISPLVRNYATKSTTTGNPTLNIPTDSRSEILKQVLYPIDSYSPNSSSPTGTYHHDHLNRIQNVIPSKEIHETIERAFQLYQRNLRIKRKNSLKIKFNEMLKACNELELITNKENDLYHRRIYEIAISENKQSERKGDESLKNQKGKKTIEQRWKETRIKGLIPREAWIPVESRGKGWDYDWRRPGH